MQSSLTDNIRVMLRTMDMQGSLILIIIGALLVVAIVEGIRVHFHRTVPPAIRFVLAILAVGLTLVYELVLSWDVVKKYGFSVDVLIAVSIFVLYFVIILLIIRDFVAHKRNLSAIRKQILEFLISTESGETTMQAVVDHLVERRQENEKTVEPLALKTIDQLKKEKILDTNDRTNN